MEKSVYNKPILNIVSECYIGSRPGCDIAYTLEKNETLWNTVHINFYEHQEVLDGLELTCPSGLPPILVPSASSRFANIHRLIV